MSEKVRAVVFTGVDAVELRDLELPPCGDDQLVAETLYTFVSPGTEGRVLAGHYGAAKRYPLVPGYSAVARVVRVGAQVTGYRAGDLVSGRNPVPLPGVNAQWGGQASMHVYRATGEDRPVVLPQGADPLDYVIAEVASISYRGVTAADARPGETAVVIGQGLIGAFSAAWLGRCGCRVIACDIDPRRLEHARGRGVAYTVDMSRDDATARLAALSDGGADIVVESSGSTAGALAAFALVRRKPQAYGPEHRNEPIAYYRGAWSRLVMQANYIEPISVNPFGFFPGEGVTIITPMDRGIEDRMQVVEHVRAGGIDPRGFVDEVLPAEQAPRGYARLASREVLSMTYKWQ